MTKQTPIIKHINETLKNKPCGFVRIAEFKALIIGFGDVTEKVLHRKRDNVSFVVKRGQWEIRSRLCSWKITDHNAINICSLDHREDLQIKIDSLNFGYFSEFVQTTVNTYSLKLNNSVSIVLYYENKSEIKDDEEFFSFWE